MIYPLYGEEGNVEFSDICLKSPARLKTAVYPDLLAFEDSDCCHAAPSNSLPPIRMK